MLKRLEEVKNPALKNQAYQFLRRLPQPIRKRIVNNIFYSYFRTDLTRPLLCNCMCDDLLDGTKTAELENVSENVYLLTVDNWKVTISVNAGDLSLERKGNRVIHANLITTTRDDWIEVEMDDIVAKDKCKKKAGRATVRALSDLYARVCRSKGDDPDLTYPRGSVADYKEAIHKKKLEPTPRECEIID